MLGGISLRGRLILIGVILTVAILVAGGSVLFLAFGSIKRPGFCTLCHETKYDYGEYAVNTDRLSSTPRGVLVGCAECHPQPFAEFEESDHYNTDETERRPGCVNCHEPHSIIRFAGYMFFAAGPWERFEDALKDNQKWEGVIRPELAREVREEFLETDSRKCRDCHEPDNVPPAEVVEEHEMLFKGEKTCIECHYNLVHKEVPWPEMEEEEEEGGE